MKINQPGVSSDLVGPFRTSLHLFAFLCTFGSVRREPARRWNKATIMTWNRSWRVHHRVDGTGAPVPSTCFGIQLVDNALDDEALTEHEFGMLDLDAFLAGLDIDPNMDIDAIDGMDIVIVSVFTWFSH